MSTLALPFFIGSSLFLQVTMTAIKAWMGSKFIKIGPGSAELAALERLKNNVVSTLAPSFLIESYSFLHVTRTAIKAWMGSKFGKI